MASSADVDKCGICHNVYDETDNIPRILDCLHVFCQPCINKMPKNAQIVCAYCKQKTTIQQELGAGLPEDEIRIRRVQMLNISKSNAKVACHGCPDKAVGKYFCKDCSYFQCKECRNQHLNKRNSVSKNHSVINIEDVTAEILRPAATKHKCREHGQPLVFYCETIECETPICASCTVDDHEKQKGHQVSKLSKVYKKKRQMIESLADTTKNTHLKRFEESLEKEENWRLNLEKEKQRCLDEVEEEYVRLKTNIDQRKLKLKQDIETNYSTLQDQIKRRIESIKTDLDKHEGACAWTTNIIDVGTEAELLRIVPLLEKRFDHLHKTCPAEHQINGYSLVYKDKLSAKVMEDLVDTSSCIDVKSISITSVEVSALNAVKNKRTVIGEVTFKDKENRPQTVDPENIEAIATGTKDEQFLCDVECKDGTTNQIYVTMKTSGRFQVVLKVFGHQLKHQGITFVVEDGQDSDDEIASEEVTDEQSSQAIAEEVTEEQSWQAKDSTTVVDKVRLVALHDYESRGDDELTFRKGDMLLLIDDVSNEDWWYARHTDANYANTRGVGYVPRNHVATENTLEAQEWFVGKVSRREAERQLLAQGDEAGIFLIRESERYSENYALSIQHADRENGCFVKHYRIRQLEGALFIAKGREFTGLKELVAFYTSQPEGLCRSLKRACPKPKPVMNDLSRKTKDAWEIPRESLEFMVKLGAGGFGEVWKGKWNRTTDVAIKTLKKGIVSMKAFLVEAKIMKQCRHDKLVRVYAVCIEQEQIHIISELLKVSLLHYLRDGDGRTLGLHLLVDLAGQVASGMAYLETHKFVHGNLAARNILVGDNNIVKVADFGLDKTIVEDRNYICPKGTYKYPVKWTAPEVLLNGELTIKSDVWSFGILFIEIATHGQIPYPGLAGSDLLKKIQNGYRMSCPTLCPEPMYNVVLKCWSRQAEERPKFEYLQYYFAEFFINTINK